MRHDYMKELEGAISLEEGGEKSVNHREEHVCSPDVTRGNENRG